MIRPLAVALTCLFLLSVTNVHVASAQGHQHRRTIIVNPVPGDPIRSGNRLLLSISHAATATAADPWLVKVEAGTYDVQGTSVVMVPFADVEGSGQGITKITGVASGVTAVLNGAADSELRDLTVENRGGGGGGTVIRNNGDRFGVRQVTAVAFGGATAGFSNSGNDTVVSDLTARVAGVPAGGVAVVNSGGRAFWKGVHASIEGSGIVYAFFSYTDSEYSEIVAEAESADAFAGGIRNEGGSPLMRNVRAYARGTIGQAITNGASSNAKLYNVFAQAVATSEFATGISNQFGSPTLKNVDVRAEGVSGAFGIASLLGATVTMNEVNAVAVAGGLGVGLLTDGSRSIAHGSTFRGDGSSVDSRPLSVSRIAGSQLDGPVAGSGVLECVFSYNALLAPLTASCTP